jgi:hypothetical protein
MERTGAAPLALGTAAVALGGTFLWLVGSLPGMVSRNVAAYLLGLMLGWASHKIAHLRHGAEVLFGIGCAILALVLMSGIEVDGIRRWLPLGPFEVQPALILSPLLLAIVGSKESRHWRFAILLPVLLVAMQPDAATLIALAAGVAALMAGASDRSQRGWSKRRIAIAGATVALAMFGLLLAGIQTPPPVAFVEGTVQIAIVSGASAMFLHLAAVAVAIGALASRGAPIDLSIAAYFVVAAIAAVFWAFPMPVAGAGASHLVGFGLAIGWLAEGVRRNNRQSHWIERPHIAQSEDT